MNNNYGLLTKPSVKMSRYWPSSFLRFMDQIEVVVNNNAKKEKYLAILTVQAWSIKDSLYGQKGNFFFLWEQRGKSRARSGSQSELRIRLISRSQPFNK